MVITAVTRAAIRRSLNEEKWLWFGALDEPSFLSRLYDLESLPSHDERFATAYEDIVQHCINNYDWDEDWVFDDPRFDLSDDDRLLKFLAETAHPEVRPDPTRAQDLVRLYNNHLRYDGVELYPKASISGRPVLGWRPAQKPRVPLQTLREAIAAPVTELKAYDVAEFCERALGLDPPESEYDDPYRSKRMYVLGKLKAKSEPELLVIARRVLEEFDAPELASLVSSIELADDGPTHGPLKNLIFAADGPKPEIVLRDAVSNDIEIVKNAEFCLVFDRPLDDRGLTWRMLVSWWGDSHPHVTERDTALDLHRRLRQGLNGAEKTMLSAYAGLYRSHGFDLPALVPQVYLHYDPYTRRQRAAPGPLQRQRMDFLLLELTRVLGHGLV